MEDNYSFEIFGKKVNASFFSGDDERSDVWYIAIDGHELRITRGPSTLGEIMVISENLIFGH